MKYRKVKYLADSYEFQKFIDKYNLKLEVVNNEKIFLISECLVFEIYGLVVEDFFYFDLYSVDLKYSTTLNRLLSAFDSEKLQSVYQTQTTNRNKILIPHLQVSQLQSNLELTLRAEVYFFTMLQLMDELLADVLSCQREIKQEYWSEIFEFKKSQLVEVIESFK